MKSVLILVLMEDTLGVEVLILQCILTMSLNPCSNGRYSRSILQEDVVSGQEVLILVLMEDTLGGKEDLETENS